MNTLKALILPLLALAAEASAQPFVAKPITFDPQPNIYSAVDWVDFDADGDLDVFVRYSTNYYPSDSYVKLYTNTDGAFTEVADAFDGIEVPTAHAFGDYDLDGDVDVSDYRLEELLVPMSTYLELMERSTSGKNGTGRVNYDAG